MLKKALADFEDIRAAVRERYGAIARERGQVSGSCYNRNGAPVSSCCGNVGSTRDSAALLGYSEEDIAAVPEGADLGLGCGTPLSAAALRPGEIVLDLGSGAGFDCFLAARQVGPTGKVIGVDMTIDMVVKARRNAITGKYAQVEFRLGEIEHLPVADTSVDAIISNCVVNLSPDKPQVFREAFRVLKNGGRLAISDVVTPISLPDEIKSDLALYSGCLSGASPINDLQAILEECGFRRIRIAPKAESREFIKDWAPGLKLEDYVVSAVIQAIKL
jgi:ubiquinone/menaquinone biosynthesis C-methylase UbiE